MVFSSNIFLFAFLPLFLAAYYLTPNRGRTRNWVILGASYLFYGWWRLDFLALFAATTVANYLIGGRIGDEALGRTAQRRWMQAGVALNLAILGYFKYANFGVDTFNDLVTSFGGSPVSFAHVLLPIGISFYTFESISYLVDVYRKDVPPTKHAVDFATFVSLFPHLIVGPIFRYKDLAEQFAHREHTLALFGWGAKRFMQGFVKKVFIADTIAPLANYCFSLSDPSTADVWLGATAFAVQLYFDFSGYSDMAIGLGAMIGFRFLENFNAPLISQSVTEFWRRWHISLSNWLRDYVYIALGGSRKGEARTYFNVWMTFFLGGIWHGANWTFVFWGALQGAMIFLERVNGISGHVRDFRWRRFLPATVATLVSFLVFRADSIGHAMHMYAAMFFIDRVGGFSAPVVGFATGLQFAALALGIGFVVLEGLREFGPKLTLGSPRFRAAAAAVILFPAFVLAISKLLSQGYTPFLYFQF